MPIADQLDLVEADLADIRAATHVQTAATMEQLAELGKMVDLAPKQGETLEHFKARLLVRFQLVSVEGTIGNLINAATLILNVRPESLKYEEPAAGSSEWGTASLTVPKDALDKAALTESDIVTILGEIMPASYTLSALTNGTFEVISETTYDAGTHPADKGFDGLDVNGDPKGVGGTFGTLLR
jgi:hypothetical protein